ncbi:MAG: UvrD-helicase domain-containing protein, partial [Qipengyuania sp.]
MNIVSQALRDEASRLLAMTAHDRSVLVEAGAGSGKTAVMAGRVVLLLAGGAEPKAIAAVTFTELAASELLARVRDFIDELLDGKVPRELR